MKLTTRARYALRFLIELAKNQRDGQAETGGEQALSIKEVATSTHLSRRYLEQLAIGLKNATLIRGFSGRSGGYVLSQPAESITIGQVIEASIGPINIVDCVNQPESCLAAEFCECRWVYELINSRILEVLNEYSLADLLDQKRLKDNARVDSCANAKGCPTR